LENRSSYSSPSDTERNALLPGRVLASLIGKKLGSSDHFTSDIYKNDESLNRYRELRQQFTRFHDSIISPRCFYKVLPSEADRVSLSLFLLLSLLR